MLNHVYNWPKIVLGSDHRASLLALIEACFLAQGRVQPSFPYEDPTIDGKRAERAKIGLCANYYLNRSSNHVSRT